MRKIIYILMFLLFVGVVSATDYQWSDSEPTLILGTEDSLTVDEIGHGENYNAKKSVNGYEIYPQTGSKLTYDGKDLIIEYKDLKDDDFTTIYYNSQDSLDFLTYCYDDNPCSFKIYLPNEKLVTADKGFKFVSENDIDFKFSGGNFDSPTGLNKFYLTAKDEFLINKIDVDGVNVEITLKDDDNEIKKEISICGKKQYAYGGSEIIGLGDGTKFSVNWGLVGEDIRDKSVYYEDSICEIDSCEYYGNPEAGGSMVTLWCNTDTEYPKFEITELNDLDAEVFKGSKPLKYDSGEWTCDGCVTSDATFKLYPVNNIPVQLIVSKFEKYYSGVNELVASEFYIGNDELYKVRPNDDNAYFKDGSLIMTLKDGGFIDIPAGAGEKSKDLELEAGHDYRVKFSSISTNNYKLDVLDCCRTNVYDGITPLDSGVGGASFENYGCTNEPEEKNRFLGFGKGVFTFSPVEGVCEESSVTPVVETEKTPAVVVTDDAFSSVNAGDFDIGEGCGFDDKQGWDYSCGIRSELDPNYCLVTKDKEGGLWTYNECSGNTGMKSDGTLGCDVNKHNDDGFYCCDPDVAAKKPYANLKDNTGKYKTIRWGTTTCGKVAATTPVKVQSYVEEGYACATDGAYACINDNVNTLAICNNGAYEDSGYYCETGVCNPYKCYEGAGITDSNLCCTTLTSCNSDSQCEDGYTCSSKNVCNVDCSRNEDCKDGYTCSSGVCISEDTNDIDADTEVTTTTSTSSGTTSAFDKHDFYYYSDSTDNIGVAEDFFGSVYDKYINAARAYEDLLVCGVEEYSLDVTNSGFTGSQADVFIDAFNQFNRRTRCIAGFDDGSIVFSKDSRLISSDYLDMNGCLFSKIELNN